MVDNRPYWTAILKLLSDGETHNKEECSRVGEAAVDPVEALRTYEHVNSNRDTNGISEMTKCVLGARELVSKSLWYMNDQGYIAVAAHDEKGQRSAYVITEKGREHLVNPKYMKPLQMRPKQTKVDMQTCAICHTDVDANAAGTWIQAVSWRQRRGGGGSNKVKDPQEPLAYAHEWCL